MSLPAAPAPKKKSALDRLKGLLTRQKKVTATPERVSEIVAKVADQIETELPPFAPDLRAFQTRLVAAARRFRKDAPIRAEVKQSQLRDFRRRARQPQSKVIEHGVFADYNGRLYLALSNGQLLRCDRPHKNPRCRDLIHTRLTEDAKAAGATVKLEASTPNA